MLIRFNRRLKYFACFATILILYLLFSYSKSTTKQSLHQRHNVDSSNGLENSPGLVVNTLKELGKPVIEVYAAQNNDIKFNKVYNFQIKEKKSVPHCKHPALESVISAPEEQFQPVERYSKSAYVFSAYHDTTGGNNQIRVFLAVEPRQSSNLYCQLWYRNDDRVMYASPGIVSFIPEGAGARYNSAYLICHNPSPETPYAVSLTREPCAEPANVLRVVEAPASPSSSKFAACITPLNLNYDKMHQLVEYIEFSKLMGVTHFYFYNYTTSQRTANILHRYGEDLVTVVQWSLPMKVHVWPVPPNYREEIKYFAQMLMLNECIMRSRAFSYVAFADLDELLVPRKHLNWHQLLTELNGLANSKEVAGWSFRNTFFKTEFASDPRTMHNHTITRLSPMTLLKTKREPIIFPTGSRSKLIVRPQMIDTMGVHNVWRTKSGVVQPLSPDLALCHHYRFWEGMGTQSFVVDDNVFRMKEELVDGLTKAYQKLQIDPDVPGN